MTAIGQGSSVNGTAQIRNGILARRDGAPRVPRVVLAGEANSGKTTLANFLLQAQLLIADIVPNTPCPTLLRFGETAHLRVHRTDGSEALRSLADLHRAGREQAHFIEVYLPSAVLRTMEILDLPGFASRAQAEAQSHWVTAADIQIWCTVATQAWKASEQAMWLSLAAPRNFSFLAVTHRDLLSASQLSDVSSRMSRETQRFFSHWTAIATPEAIAARNPRGQIVRKDVWTSTGVEEFMKNLMHLLQGVMMGRPDAPTPRGNTVPAANSPPSQHPLASFAQVRRRILHALDRQQTAQDAATMMAEELGAYSRTILMPWIAANGASSEAARIEGFIPGSDTEIMEYLTPPAGHSPPATPVKILKQIEAELTEALQFVKG